MVLWKILFQGKWAILGLKMACPRNSGSALRIFLKFCIVTGAKRFIEIILMVFILKNIIWGKSAILGLKMTCPCNLGSAQRMFLKFCTTKGTKGNIEIILMVFLKKKSYFRQIGHFGSENGVSL